MTSYYGTGTGGLSEPDLATLNSDTRLIPMDEALASSDFHMARKLYEFWRAQAEGIPNSEQLKPGSLDPTVMPNMVILDVLEDGKDYQWRLFGTAHTDQYGDDLTGRRLSSVEAENSSAKALRRIFDQAIASANGTFFELHYLSEGQREKIATGLMAPLSDKQGQIIQLCGCCDWC